MADLDESSSPPDADDEAVRESEIVFIVGDPIPNPRAQPQRETSHKCKELLQSLIKDDAISLKILLRGENVRN